MMSRIVTSFNPSTPESPRRRVPCVAWHVIVYLFAVAPALSHADPPVPEKLQRWLGEQNWERDTELPVVSLGAAGQFDDTHIFAPCVALENDQFRLWYCGSQGTVARRVFQLGLATSKDGRRFEKFADSPVYAFGDGKHSVLTPTLLRDHRGAVLREDGQLRMWFAATDFTDGTGRYTLHEASSRDGLKWSQPSAAQLEHIYAPTVLKVGDKYRMWYSDVSAEPWVIRHAQSSDGSTWRVTPEPVMKIDQAWEQGRLFYPAVVYDDGVFVIWYGSYWSAHPSKTAIGCAASLDGIRWTKSPHNPVMRPDPSRAWESHYTTSQSVLRLADGTWRIWYASRKKPPFVNKYFAIGTAKWTGPAKSPPEPKGDAERAPDPALDRAAFVAWQASTREALSTMLGIPAMHHLKHDRENTKSEAQSRKYEIRSTKSETNTNVENSNVMKLGHGRTLEAAVRIALRCFDPWVFEFRICFEIRISCFGFTTIQS